ncbi:MAG: peptide chain release factor N(5)-glutamine methyltransferase [Candidatus Thioglobus sp.]|nr:peptide chain release factor N(5)-glutamine methyltransferase [Candidatus Thioglobus sp.]
MSSIHNYLKSGVEDIIPLLGLLLKKSHAELISISNYQLNLEQKKRLEVLIKQRQKGKPFAYQSGIQGFYHLDFKVTPSVLIPRPETELLIDISLDLFPKKQAVKLLDLGTGCGIIAITLKDKNPHWSVTATDFSAAALRVAEQNCQADISFQQGDWFAAAEGQTFDLIISNPPYIPAGDCHLAELTFEPQNALVSGADGLKDIKIIINNSHKYLQKSGYLLLEHGQNQRANIVKLLGKKFHNIQTFKDYNLQDRAILAQIKN